MAHGNYHWLLFTIYLNTPHDQQQYTLRKEKKALHERYNAFQMSAGLLRAVVLRGVGIYWVKRGGFFLIRCNNKNKKMTVNKVTTSWKGRAASSENGSPWQETRMGSVSRYFLLLLFF